MRLDKEYALMRVKASRQPVKQHLVDIFLQFTGVFQRGQGVNVNYAIDAIVFILKFYIVLNSPQKVPQVLPAGGTGPGENTLLHLDLLDG
jgi:hypothetical protein